MKTTHALFACSSVLALAALAAVASFSGCSSSSSSAGGGAADASPDVASKCGHPGDVGNTFGVGTFCQNFHDCAGNSQAHLCSVIGDMTTHFCTMTCTPADAGTEAGTDAADQPTMNCGANATCACGGAGCGCTPNTCL